MKLKKSSEKSLLEQHDKTRAAPTPPATIAYVDGRFFQSTQRNMKQIFKINKNK